MGTREIRMGKTEGEKDSILRETTGIGDPLGGKVEPSAIGTHGVYERT